MQRLTNYVFATYTYSRDIPIHNAWSATSKDFNRYVQNIRRLHNAPVQYLRSIEAHKDGYPHLHAVIRFPSPITVNNTKYFDRELYKKWKSLWPSGLSDYQVPLSRRHPILYIVKYVTKGSTLKTLWKKYYALYAAKPLKKEKETSSANIVDLSVPTPLTITCKKYKIKQLSWSRLFFTKLLPLVWSPQGQATGGGGSAASLIDDFNT